MSSTTISKEDLSDIVSRCKSLHQQIKAFKGNNGTAIHISKEAVEKLHEDIKDLIIKADSLGIVNKNALAKSGVWMGNDIHFREEGRRCTYTKREARIFYPRYNGGLDYPETERVKVYKSPLKDLERGLNSVFKPASKIIKGENIESPAYARKHAPDWKPRKLAA